MGSYYFFKCSLHFSIVLYFFTKFLIQALGVWHLFIHYLFHPSICSFSKWPFHSHSPSSTILKAEWDQSIVTKWGSGCLMLKSHLRGQVGGKEVYSRDQQLGVGWGRAATSPKTDSSLDRGQELLQAEGGAPCRAPQSAPTLIFKFVTSGLTSIILMVPYTLVFSSRLSLFPFPCGQFSELWLCRGYSLAIVSLTSSTRCGFQYKTAHGIWFRILALALEKELKVLDCA